MNNGNSQRLPFYLRKHMAKATAEVALFDQVASRYGDDEIGTEVTWLRTHVQQDRDTLSSIMGDLGVQQASSEQPTGERDGSFGAIDIGLDTLTVAVESKIQLWETLLAMAERDTRLDTDSLHTLHDRATAQRETLIELSAQPERTLPVRQVLRARNRTLQTH